MTARGPVVGFTGMKSPHIVPAEERNSMVQVADMFLDLGVKNRDEAEKLGVSPGLPMTYRTEQRPSVTTAHAVGYVVASSARTPSSSATSRLSPPPAKSASDTGT